MVEAVHGKPFGIPVEQFTKEVCPLFQDATFGVPLTSCADD